MTKIILQGMGLLLIPFICGGLVTVGLHAIECPLFLNGYWTACAYFISQDIFQMYLKREDDNR